MTIWLTLLLLLGFSLAFSSFITWYAVGDALYVWEGDYAEEED